MPIIPGHKNVSFLSLLAMTGVMLFPVFSAAHAACSSPAGVEGAVIYNADAGKPQYCNGTNWVEMIRTVSGGGGGDGCTPDPACPNVGDVCSGDGSGGGNPKFAGCITYHDANSADDGMTKALYVTQANQSTSTAWTGPGTDDINPDSMDDGRINHANLTRPISNFPAIEMCENLTDGGYTDWYLPARGELDLLWRNKDVITGFTSLVYWSSSERDPANTMMQSFTVTGKGAPGMQLKHATYGVRCVRRD